MAFDPYESWLGISAVDRPPTHYDLLGLPVFESSSETIERAALRRMNKVRQYQIGPHSDLSQEILAELARARLVLIDADRRAVYDAKLRAHDERATICPTAPETICSGAAVPSTASVDEGLSAFSQLKVNDVSRSVIADDAAKFVDSDVIHQAFEPVADGLGGLALVEPGTDVSLSKRPTKRKPASAWKIGIAFAVFAMPHVAAVWAFFVYGRDIAAWVRSFFDWNNPADRAELNPPGRRAVPSDVSPRPTDPYRIDPKTWLKFERGDSITIAKSEDFDMSEHDYTIFAQIKTATGGTLFSVTAAAGGWGPGCRRLFIDGGRIAFEVGGNDGVATPRQVDDDRWHAVAMTYTHKTRQVFLFVDGDGVTARKPLAKGNASAGQIVRIGSCASKVALHQNQHYVGWISDVRFYDRVLSKEEIDGLPARQPIGGPPLARWSLKQRRDNFVPDMTRHGHDGTLETGSAPSALPLAANNDKDAKARVPSDPENGLARSPVPPAGGNNRQNRDGVENEEHGQARIDDAPEDVLRNRGLKRKGLLYVPDTEDDVQAKATETRLLAERMHQRRRMQQPGNAPEDIPRAISQLEGELSRFRYQIQQLDQGINVIPKHRGRFHNNQDEQLDALLRAQKADLEQQSRFATEWLNELKRRQSDPQPPQSGKDLVRDDQRLYDEALREFRRLVDATNRRLRELSEDNQVKTALDVLAKKANAKLELGLSPEFLRQVKLLEGREKEAKRRGK